MLPLHLLDIKQLSASDIQAFIERASQIKKFHHHQYAPLNTLENQTVVQLFFEPSTRTRVSFELATKRLRGDVINIDISTSSVQKGESLVDMVNNLHAMYCSLFVIRHYQSRILHSLSQMKNLNPQISLINAGDGTNEHPTQALTDMFTIYEHFQNFSDLKVAIIGDLLHSRVANSQIQSFLKLGTKDIRLIAPKNLLPESPPTSVHCFTNLKEALENVNVIITLRVQKERMETYLVDSIENYQKSYCLKQKHLEMAHPKAIVMHPGPINRNIEIEDSVADSSHSVILNQVSNGIAMRMAVLEWIKNKKSEM